jgi:hypothetical protein
MTMDLDELLERFQALHGNVWPGAVLDRFVYLVSRPSTLTDKEEAEYILLRDWIQEMIVAGIAFRQQSLVKH